MDLRRNTPFVKNYTLFGYIGTTITKSFRITNSFGEPLNMFGHSLKAHLKKDHCVYCDPIELCVYIDENNCSNVCLEVDARITENLKGGIYTFKIDLNPLIPMDEMNKNLKIIDVENVKISANMTIEELSDHTKLEKFIPKYPTMRVVEGSIIFRC